MKKRKIIMITYELLGELLGIKPDEFITDVISDSSEKRSEKILIKLATSKEFNVPEGTEIPQVSWRYKGEL